MTKSSEKEIIFAARNENGFLAEWIGRGLQNLVRRFDSARNLMKPAEFYKSGRFFFARLRNEGLPKQWIILYFQAFVHLNCFR